MGIFGDLDVAVIGASLSALAVAREAAARGLRVGVFDEDGPRQMVSNSDLGLVSSTLLAGETLEHASYNRSVWSTVATDLGLSTNASGTLVVARTPAECDLVEELGALGLYDGARQVTADQARWMTGAELPDLRAALHLSGDAVVDVGPLLPGLVALLEDRGVGFEWDTSVWDVEGPGDDGHLVIRTTRGLVRAASAVVCSARLARRLFSTPDRSGSPSDLSHRAQRLGLVLATDRSARAQPTLVSASALINRAALVSSAAAELVFEERAHHRPDLLAADLELSVIRLPSGRLSAGTARTGGPGAEYVAGRDAFQMLLDEAERLVGGSLRAEQVWLRADPGESAVRVDRPSARVRVVRIPEHLQASTAFGVARGVVEEISDPSELTA